MLKLESFKNFEKKQTLSLVGGADGDIRIIDSFNWVNSDACGNTDRVKIDTCITW